MEVAVKKVGSEGGGQPATVSFFQIILPRQLAKRPLSWSLSVIQFLCPASPRFGSGRIDLNCAACSYCPCYRARSAHGHRRQARPRSPQAPALRLNHLPCSLYFDYCSLDHLKAGAVPPTPLLADFHHRN